MPELVRMPWLSYTLRAPRIMASSTSTVGNPVGNRLRAPEIGVLLVEHHVAGVRDIMVLAEAARQRLQQVERQRARAGLRLPARFRSSGQAADMWGKSKTNQPAAADITQLPTMPHAFAVTTIIMLAHACRPKRRATHMFQPLTLVS